jgi:hypothetical protein
VPGWQIADFLKGSPRVRYSQKLEGRVASLKKQAKTPKRAYSSAIREAELKELRSAHFRRLLIRARDEGLFVGLRRDAGFHVTESALETLATYWLRPLWLRSGGWS